MALQLSVLARFGWAITLAVPISAQAVVVQFTAELDGASEIPSPVSTAGQGLAILSYDTLTDLFDFSLAAGGLSGPATAAHLHALASPFETAPPVVNLLSGFDVASDGTSLLVGGFDVPSPGIIESTNGHGTMSFRQALGEGHVYVNVHTALYPGGEIRGHFRFARALPIPEPSTWAMMFVGLAAVGGLAARRRA